MCLWVIFLRIHQEKLLYTKFCEVKWINFRCIFIMNCLARNMLFLVNMWSVELVLRTYSYKKLFVWKKSLWNIFCLKEIFDLGSIHKVCSYVIGGKGLQKSIQIQTERGRAQLKVDVHLERKRYTIFFKKYSNR